MELTADVSLKGTGLFPNRFDFEGCGAATNPRRYSLLI
jgi:hypothetical protein